ncbi:MAG: LuxR C-terminal-related transcriptional regulator [Parachlamydia sp.]|nr:LuxR C-terminal-related transcriptional regulator [Parachlamydia sp.]
MSKTVEEYVQHYIDRYHDRVKAVFEPLQRCFGINYFTYHSITEDGLWRPLVSRPDYAAYYTEKQLCLYDPCLLHPRCYRPGVLFWTQFTQDLDLKKVMAKAMRQHGMAHGYLIVEPQATSCEFFGFTAPPEMENIYDVYVNQLPLLKKFCRYFKQQLEPILRLIDRDPIDLLALKGKAFSEAEGNPFVTPDTTRFVASLDSFCSLSKQERRCLSHYLDVSRMSDVAELMQLSVRTVEFYLSNIKGKLRCDDKIELLKKAKELRSLGEIE